MAKIILLLQFSWSPQTQYIPASMTTASTHRFYIWPPYKTSWEL